MEKINLCKEDRIDYKILNKGTSYVTDSELISVILGESVPDLSRKLLGTAENNLHELGKNNYYDLRKSGVTHSKAITLMAAIELGRRRKLTEPVYRDQIKCSDDIFNIFNPVIGDLGHEEFWILFLNRGVRVIDKQILSKGGIDGTVTDVRIIMKMAIELQASCFIMCHNHPSGNLNPSEADNILTKKIKEAGTIMNMQLLDHVIIADNKYYSFADNGLI